MATQMEMDMSVGMGLFRTGMLMDPDQRMQLRKMDMLMALLID
jgi:hypothetical protein